MLDVFLDLEKQNALDKVLYSMDEIGKMQLLRITHAVLVWGVASKCI